VELVPRHSETKEAALELHHSGKKAVELVLRHSGTWAAELAPHRWPS